jgi:hypothetical protein
LNWEPSKQNDSGCYSIFLLASTDRCVYFNLDLMLNLDFGAFSHYEPKLIP